MKHYRVIRPQTPGSNDWTETVKADGVTFPSGCLVLSIEDDELNSIVVKAYGAGQWISVEEAP